MRIEFRQADSTNSTNNYLREFRGNVTSQFGEDGIIAKIFDIMGETNKFCIEFGAWDGRLASNTWTLINNGSWRGVLIEGDLQRFHDLIANCEGKQNAILVNKYVGFGENSLDAILKAAGCPNDPDLLSIDIDGMDWYVWNQLEHFSPRLVVIEFNPTIPNDVFFVQARDQSFNHGSSLLALIELARQKGYELVVTTDVNAFFVRSDLFHLFGIEDNSIGAIHNPGAYESRIFQLYDGTLVLAGRKSLFWSEIPIEDWMLQPLAKRHRRFPPAMKRWSLRSRIFYRIRKLAQEMI